MANLVRLPLNMLRAMALKPPAATASPGPAISSSVAAESEQARLLRRLEQLQESIRTLETAPGNPTSTAMLARYRENEQRLLRACRRAELHAATRDLPPAVMTPG